MGSSHPSTSWLCACVRHHTKELAPRHSMAFFLHRRRAQHKPMQRLYSMFPAGRPGLALVFLRGAVCFGLHLSTHVALMSEASSIERLGELTRFVLCLALLVGLASPVAAALAFVASVWGLVAFADGHGICVVTALDALALYLLGPGAYSLDSRIFGRRLLVIPPSD